MTWQDELGFHKERLSPADPDDPRLKPAKVCFVDTTYGVDYINLDPEFTYVWMKEALRERTIDLNGWPDVTYDGGRPMLINPEHIQRVGVVDE